MIETAILTIRGKRFLFRSFDDCGGEFADRPETPGMNDSPLIQAGQTARGDALLVPPQGVLTRLSNLPHSAEVSQ